MLHCFSQIHYSHMEMVIQMQVNHVNPDTRPVGVELRKKPKDLSASESEECGHGEGGGV